MSTTKSYEKEPGKFPWESEIPTSPFWDGLSRLAQQALTIFGHADLAALDLDSKADQPKPARLALVRGVFEQRLAKEPPLADQDDAQFRTHRQTVFALAHACMMQRDYAEAEAACHQLIAASSARDGKPDVGALQTLAWATEARGQYGDALNYCEQTLPLLKAHEMLGPESPQVLGTMRLEMQALGKAGRVKEALEMNAQGYEVIERMKGGRFGKYYGEEIEAMDELKKVLQDAEKEGGKVPAEWMPAGMDM